MSIVAEGEFEFNGLEYESGERVKLAPAQSVVGEGENALGEPWVAVQEVEVLDPDPEAGLGDTEPNEIIRKTRIPARLEE